MLFLDGSIAEHIGPHIGIAMEMHYKPQDQGEVPQHQGEVTGASFCCQPLQSINTRGK